MKNISYKKNIIKKANNNMPIRVLYKKVGQTPNVKIIDNVYKLKKAIIKRNLDIVPYEHLFIICNSKRTRQNMKPNIYLPLTKIGGDLIVVKIDKKDREFKSLPQDDILWFSQDLINKNGSNTTSIKVTNNTKPITNTTEKQKYFIDFYGRDFDNTNKQHNFENDLINALIGIEITLHGLLENNKKGE